jgi:hypothetical protein
MASTVDLRPGDFRLQRKQVRDCLAQSGLAARLDRAVTALWTETP